MMHRMVVEIEEQRPPGEPGLVDHRAGQRVIRGAVFEKRAYFGQGQRRVAHRQHKPQRRKPCAAIQVSRPVSSNRCRLHMAIARRSPSWKAHSALFRV